MDGKISETIKLFQFRLGWDINPCPIVYKRFSLIPGKPFLCAGENFMVWDIFLLMHK
jgi:hypothetical protein